MEKRLYCIKDKDRPVSETLRRENASLEMRCGGSGKCGKCLVKLVTGQWMCRGKKVLPPEKVPACVTFLESSEGIVEIPENGADAEVETDCTALRRPIAFSADAVAVDLGTTTVAAACFGADGRIKSVGNINYQQIYGDNVLDRISAARSGALDELRLLAVRSINELLHKLDVQKGRMVIAANSVMALLLHGISPESVGSYPFVLPVKEFPSKIRGLEFDGVCHTLEPYSAYIGGDIRAGLAEVALKPGEMLIDLGTNCEIVFRQSSGEYRGVTAAAGPAFEGCGINCGRRAGKGVMTAWYSFDDYLVCGGGVPHGASVGALIDFLAAGRACGAVGSNGMINGAEKIALAPGVELDNSEIAALLTAKAAVAAAVGALEDSCGEKAEKIYLAGGVSRSLNIYNACAAGVLPRGRQYVSAGNSALSGALRFAASSEECAVPQNIQVTPADLLDGYRERFISGLTLAPVDW